MSKSTISKASPGKKREVRNNAQTPAAAVRQPTAAPASKSEMLLALLRRSKGANVTELAEAVGWQAHSVRGFLSGTVKKKRGLAILVDSSSGTTRYRVRPAKA